MRLIKHYLFITAIIMPALFGQGLSKDSHIFKPSELVQTQEEYQILEKIHDELLQKEDYEKCSAIREVLDNFDLNDLPKLQIISDDDLESNGSMKSVDFGTISLGENGGVF